MLEAMAEFQVTVLGNHYPLVRTETAEFIEIEQGSSTPLGGDMQTPFLVLATQNPIEQDGVYPLPEAQLDRFLMKVLMPFPVRAVMDQILEKEIAALPSASTGTIEGGMQRAETLVRLQRLGQELRQVKLAPHVQAHVLNLLMASTLKFDQVEDLSNTRKQALMAFCNDAIDYPLGPRAATALALCALGWSAISATPVDDPDLISMNSHQGLAATSTAVLRHRLRFRRRYEDSTSEETDSVWHDRMVREFVALAAPDQDGYDERFSAAATSFAEEVQL